MQSNRIAREAQKLSLHYRENTNRLRQSVNHIGRNCYVRSTLYDAHHTGWSQGWRKQVTPIQGLVHNKSCAMRKNRSQISACIDRAQAARRWSCTSNGGRFA